LSQSVTTSSVTASSTAVPRHNRTSTPHVTTAPQHHVLRFVPINHHQQRHCLLYRYSTSPPHLNTTHHHRNSTSRVEVCPNQPPSAASLPPLPPFHVTTAPQHHVFFVHHPDQKDWVFGVMERLELQSASPGGFKGLRCTSLSQIAAAQGNVSLFQALYQSLGTNAVKSR